MRRFVSLMTRAASMENVPSVPGGGRGMVSDGYGYGYGYSYGYGYGYSYGYGYG